MITSTMQDDFPLTIGAIMRHGVSVYGASECVTWTGAGARRASFRTVAANAARLASALAGLGVANAFPAAMSRVGLLAGPHGVAVASTLGYGGFLLGPPVIGFLTAAVGLGPALTTVSALALVSAALGWSLTKATSRGRKRTRQTPSSGSH